MTEALLAEWTKLRTLAGTGWLLAGTLAVTAGSSAAIAAATHQSTPGGDPTKLALSGVDVGQAVIVVLAVLTISEEYGTGMVAVTLAAMPRRRAVLAAKAANIAGLTLAVGIFAVAASLLAGRVLLPGAGFDSAHGYALVSITHSSTMRAATGSVLYLVLIGLLALGVATAIRDTAVSIGAMLALLYLPPLLAGVVGEPLRRHLEQVFPMTAGLAAQATTNLRTLPIAPWAGLGVLAAWAGAALVVGGVLLRIRDA